MKISSLLNDINKFEERKYVSQRREMAKAYKKSSTFIEASKNPVTNLLNELLKSEKDLAKQLHNPVYDELKQAELEIASASGNDEIEPNRIHQLKDNHLNLISTELNKFVLFEESKIESEQQFASRTNVNNNFIKNKFQRAITTYSYQMKFAKTGFIQQQSQYNITA
ncbi:hypothetical protein [Ureibacillus acetophenoni]|uniref:Uncharacterized protein n=1 Tax=Ureibacillus acetophenoni TaxID=614649 RepID=A0A285UCZ6_9BACL|nr:hypothetical protein [Ureibacillus acetophenoni]SOC39613.1 hypothetical protein SAMN05877842_10628 [Ureibacillus acetophenoni]